MRTRPFAVAAGIFALVATSALGASTAIAAGSPTDTRTSITVDCTLGEGSNDNQTLLAGDVLTITLLHCEDWEMFDNDGNASMTVDLTGTPETLDFFIVPSDAPTFVVTVDSALLTSGEADLELWEPINEDDIDIDVVVATPAATPSGSLLATERVTMPVAIDAFAFATDLIGGPDSGVDSYLGGDTECEMEAGYHPYRVLPITISTAGEFTFRVIDVTPVDEDLQWGQPYLPSQDLFLAVYTDFDATDAEANLVSCNDDRPDDNVFVVNGGTTYISDDQTPEFVATLEPGNYDLVLTTNRSSSSSDWAAGQFSTWSGVAYATWEPQPMSGLFELWGPSGSLTVGDNDVEAEVEPELADTGAKEVLGPIGLGALAIALFGGAIVAARRQRA